MKVTRRMTMFKNRLANIILIILLTLTIIGLVAFILYTYVSNDGAVNSEPSIDEIMDVTVETNEITTNLLSNHVIRTNFVIQLDNKKAKEELEKRNFQVNNIIIQELADREESDFSGSENIMKLEEEIGNRINEILDEGYVVEVYINQLVIQ